jgi:hypothetical protein
MQGTVVTWLQRSRIYACTYPKLLRPGWLISAARAQTRRHLDFRARQRTCLTGICDIATNDQERTPMEAIREGTFHGLREARPRRKENRGAETDVFDQQLH